MKKQTLKLSVFNTVLSMLFLSSAPFSSTHAADKYWSISSCGSSWWDYNCWSATFGGPLDGTGQPVALDSVYLYNDTVNNYTVSYWNALYPTDTLNSLIINATGTGTMTLSQSTTHNLTTDIERVGTDGSGAVNQSAGTHNVSSFLMLGDSATGNGSFTVSNTAILSVNEFQIGASGTGNLSIQSGGTVSSNSSYLGHLTGSNGTAVINGIASSWTNSFLSIGSYGIGNLAIQSGGVVTSSNDAHLGANTGGNGSVTVVGADSKWDVSNNLYVGHDGIGELIIQNGGAVSNSNAYIGFNAGSSGTVTVTGTGSSSSSSWDISGTLGELFVGNNGTGTLSILNGGVVNDTVGLIGYNAGSNGSLTVDGTGSSWNNSAGTSVGSSGIGLLSIQNGGLVTNTSAILGGSSTGNGNAIVDGAGSSWDMTGPLHVGNYGTGTLSIQNGGVVSNNLGHMGSNAGGYGSVTVNGVGSSWNNSGELYVGEVGTGVLTISNGGAVTSSDLYVGENGTGTLHIQSGGVVTNSTGYLGNNVGSNGSVTVDGTGSSWNNSGELYVSNSGNGTLNILNGGSVSSASGIVGWNGGYGSVTVDGTGSSWNNSGELVVASSGLSASSSLVIQNGGSVSSSLGRVGVASNGSVTVDGTGSTWTNTTDLEIGVLGTGTLDIINGGNVSSKNGFLGNWFDVAGSANVSGTGSNWNISNILILGDPGIGALNITNGGIVASTSSFLGYGSSGSGTVNVDGIGSTWSNSIDLYVGGGSGGSAGTGEVNVYSGGTVNVGDTLTVWNTGTVNLNGGTANIGTLDGTGVFNFNAGTLNVSASLLLNPNRPLGSSLSLTGFKALNVAGTTTLESYNTLSLDGGILSTGSLIDNGGFIFNSGTFNLTNDNLVIGLGGLFDALAQFNFGQTVNVTNTTTVNAGSILALNNSSFSSGTINNNGQIALDGLVASLNGGTLNNAGMLTGNGQVRATLNNTINGEVRANSSDALVFTAAGNTNDSRISLLGGSVDFREGLTNNSTGQIIGHGTLATGSASETGLVNLGQIALSGNTDIIGDVNNTGAGAIIISGGTTTTFHDDVIHNGDEIRVSENSQAVFFGDVSGAGAYKGIGTVYFEGAVLPGNSPALVTMEGNMVLADSASVLIELGGLLSGEYDAFEIGGDLTLGGELEVSFWDLTDDGLDNPFSASLGDSFDIFSAENLYGDFDLLTFALLGDGLGWQLDFLVDEFGTTDIARLSVISASTVPVPPSVWLFGSGLLGLVGVARRTRGREKVA